LKGDRYVAVAEVARPHGVAGELRLRVYNPDSDLFARRPKLRLACADGSVKHATIRALRVVPGAVLVRLSGVTDREQAEALRGAKVEVHRDELDPPGEDEYYFCDLIGCRVDVAGASFGTVVAVNSYPSCDALLIERADGQGRVEVPLADEEVANIDLVSEVIELARLPGPE
jgi:16S rRNA processing protein RimM